MDIRTAIRCHWDQILNLNMELLSQLRQESNSLSTAHTNALSEAPRFNIPQPIGLEVWAWNTLLLSGAAFLLSLCSLLFGTSAARFTVIVCTVLIVTWAMLSLAAWGYVKYRISIYVKSFLHAALNELRSMRDLMKEKLGELDARTASYFFSLPASEANGLLGLISLQDTLAERVEKIEVLMHTPTPQNWEKTLHLLKTPLTFSDHGAGSQFISLALIGIPPFWARRLKLLEEKFADVEEARREKRAAS